VRRQFQLMEWVETENGLKIRLIEQERTDEHVHSLVLFRSVAPEVIKERDGCWFQVSLDETPNARP